MAKTTAKSTLIKDTRKSRFVTRYYETIYNSREVGVQEITVRNERIARGDIREILEDTAKEWLEGKLEPFEVRETGSRPEECAAHTRKYNWVIVTRSSGKRRFTKKRGESPLELKHVLAVKWFNRGLDNEEVDWETEQPVKPWAAITLYDGSRVHVEIPFDTEKIDDGYTEVAAAG